MCQITLCLLGESLYHFHTRAKFQLRMSRILFAAKHSRQLFAGHVVSSRPMKKMEKNTSYDDSIGLLQQTITCYMVAGKLIVIPALGH